MRIKAIMTPISALEILSPDDTAAQAIERIDKNGFLSLPVASGKKFIGFLSKQFIYDTYFKTHEGDLETFLERPVSAFIHNRVEPISPDYFVEEAANIFFKNKVRFLPVVDEHDAFVGIVTQKSLFGILTRIYGLYDPKISILTDDFKGTLNKITEVISKNDGNITNIALLDTEVMGIQEISIRLEAANVERIVKKLEEKGFKIREFVPSSRLL
ncbi:MAG: acetoin utilization protein AcuB [Clostridiales bacterium]|jgi:acetoin utilization protein AcuB|nr:acetoin utilization protein AcuB [Clostridiales bacterium]